MKCRIYVVTVTAHDSDEMPLIRSHSLIQVNVQVQTWRYVYLIQARRKSSGLYHLRQASQIKLCAVIVRLEAYQNTLRIFQF